MAFSFSSWCVSPSDLQPAVFWLTGGFLSSNLDAVCSLDVPALADEPVLPCRLHPAFRYYQVASGFVFVFSFVNCLVLVYGLLRNTCICLYIFLSSSFDLHLCHVSRFLVHCLPSCAPLSLLQIASLASRVPWLAGFSVDGSSSCLSSAI